MKRKSQIIKKRLNLAASFSVSNIVQDLCLRQEAFSKDNIFIWERNNEKQNKTWLPSRFSEVLIEPAKLIRLKLDRVSRVFPEIQEELILEGDPIELLEKEFKQHRDQLIEDGLVSLLPDLACYGILAYDAARYIEPTVRIEPNTQDPDLLAVFPGTVLKFDRKEKSLSYIGPKDRLEAVVKSISVESSSDQTISSSPLAKQRVFQPRFSSAEFQAKVRTAKDYIVAGDAFQIVLANTFSAKWEGSVFQDFSWLSQNNPSPFHFCIVDEDWSVVGASPELYLQGEGSKVQMRLVAGTYPRLANPIKDQLQGAALLEDEKELAEHYMLLDHARNDLGRGAKIGSVKPLELLSVDSYRDVHHLVSTVGAELSGTSSLFSAFRNCFPIATLCGTPKVRAMQIIENLEGSRGVFGGSVFRFGFDDSLDSAVLIRSAVYQGGRKTVKAGCGLVFDSVPEREDQECYWKASALVGEIG